MTVLAWLTILSQVKTAKARSDDEENIYVRAYRVARRVLGTLHVLFVKPTKSGYHALLCYREEKLELWEVKHRTSPKLYN